MIPKYARSFPVCNKLAESAQSSMLGAVLGRLCEKRVPETTVRCRLSAFIAAFHSSQASASASQNPVNAPSEHCEGGSDGFEHASHFCISCQSLPQCLVKTKFMPRFTQFCSKVRLVNKDRSLPLQEVGVVLLDLFDCRDFDPQEVMVLEDERVDHRH